MAETKQSDGFAALKRFVNRPAQPAVASVEQCEFCAQPIPAQHRHLLQVESREVKCVCVACSILFDRQAASQGKYRLIPDRRLNLAAFQMSDWQWDGLRLPVDIAFFFYSSAVGKVVAYYPSPIGPTESLLQLSAWAELEAENPILKGMAPDVEALLVNRVRGARRHFLVPIDDCYRLIAILRTHWRGFTGGAEVWEEIDRFFEELSAVSQKPKTES